MKALRGIKWGLSVSFLTIAFLLQTGIAAAAEKSLADMKPRVWRTQSIVPKGHYVCQALIHFSDEVLKRTDGKLKIEVYASGGLGYPIPQTASITRDGLMNVGELLGAFTHGEFPLADIMELPGLVPWDLELKKKVAAALGPYYDKALREKYNQYYLGGWQNDFRAIALHDKKVGTLGGLKGLKIRASGPNEVALCRALDAAPVSITTPEVYPAMARGTVDACFGADSWYMAGKFWEVAKYVYSMEFDGHQMIWTVNKDDFDGLPPDVQKIVREAASHAIAWVWPEVFEQQKGGREEMMKHGVEYLDITREDWEKLGEIGKPIVDKWIEDGGAIGKEMVEVVRKIVADWKAKKK
jgi:TRAP-type C4-dicarboxylate transport system substrate-binding protein